MNITDFFLPLHADQEAYFFVLSHVALTYDEILLKDRRDTLVTAFILM